MNSELPCGKIVGEANEVYHASPSVSVSKMKVFRHSPALYHGRFITKRIPPPEPTPALLFGSAAGALILEGRAAFDERYYVVPEGVGRVRKEDKELRAVMAANNPGKEPLKYEDAMAIERMNKNVHAHHLAGPLLAACKPEITWRIKGDTFHVQVRTDGWSDEGCELTQGVPFICDLKTIPSLPDDEPDTIPRQIADFWYHGQAYVYREIVSEVMKYPPTFRPPFYFGFVEKEEPFAVEVVELDDVSLELANRQVAETITRLKTCYQENHWPLKFKDSWQKKVPAVTLPAYYLKREAGGADIW